MWSFQSVSGLARTGAIAWERFATRWTDAIVYVSDDERRVGEDAGIRGLGHVVPNGVDVEAVTAASAEDRREARGRLGLGDMPLVLCLGNIRHSKGQDVLLDAWPEVLARVPGAQLVFVGDGRDRASSSSETSRAPSSPERDPTSATGWRRPTWSPSPRARRPCRSYCSRRWRRGRSVVASDVSGVREALGEAGAVVPSEAVAPLAAALSERLLDPQRAAAEGEAARSRAERYFDIRRTSALIADVYEDVIAAATA